MPSGGLSPSLDSPAGPKVDYMSFDHLGLDHLGLDHLGIATPDLDEGSRPYLMLGMTPEGPDELIAGSSVRVRAFRAGSSLIELVAPASAGSPIERFLGRRGPGLHHAAFSVTRLDAALERLRGQGAVLIDEKARPGRAGTRVAFLHPRWAGGTLIELVEYPRRTE